MMLTGLSNLHEHLHTVKPILNGHCDVRTPSDKGTFSHNSVLSFPYTVTPFKFAAIKVRGFEIMTYSRPFNFAVSYQNYFTVSYTHVVFSYTN